MHIEGPRLSAGEVDASRTLQEEGDEHDGTIRDLADSGAGHRRHLRSNNGEKYFEINSTFFLLGSQ